MPKWVIKMFNTDNNENVEEKKRITKDKSDGIILVVKKFIDNVFSSAINKIKPPLMKLIVYICAVAFIAFIISVAFIDRKHATLLFIAVLVLLALLTLFAFIFALQDRRYRYLEKQYHYLADSEEALKEALRNLIQNSMLKKEREKQNEEKK
jgi:ABC-type multidrug transport system fused ATPase/permease subunit